jgi:hypothetical protein
MNVNHCKLTSNELSRAGMPMKENHEDFRQTGTAARHRL